jgi:hypothetical protein
MNDPYPTNAQLEAEAEADQMLAEQAADTAAFGNLIRHVIAETKKLYFPLGSPAAGWDLDDITGAMRDWLKPRDAYALEREADDIVRVRWALS